MFCFLHESTTSLAFCDFVAHFVKKKRTAELAIIYISMKNYRMSISEIARLDFASNNLTKEDKALQEIQILSSVLYNT